MLGGRDSRSPPVEGETVVIFSFQAPGRVWQPWSSVENDRLHFGKVPLNGLCAGAVP